MCHSYHSGHVRGCRSLSATDDILTGSHMVRLAAQQRAELVRLHLQGESIDAIVQQGTPARPCCDGCAASLLMACCWTGRSAIERHDAHCGRSDQTIGEGQTRSSESINASDCCCTELSRDSHQPQSKGVKPYVQPQVPLQRYGDKQRRLCFAAEQKERDWPLVYDPRPNRRNDVIWTG